MVGAGALAPGEATARVLGGFRRTAADRGRGQAAPLRADGLAAILATAARPRTDGRGVESHTTAHRRGRLDAVIAGLLFMGGLRRSATGKPPAWSRTTRRARPLNAGPSHGICKGGDGGTARQHYGITRASLRDEFPLSGDRVPHLRTTSTPQHAGAWSLQGVTGVSSFFWRAASWIARLSSRVASGTSDKSSIRSETSATRCIGGTCTLSARAARRKFGPSFAVRNPCARVVSASLHAVTFDTIWSSEVRAIHSSRARLRLTHLCRADQRSQCFTVVTSGPDDAVLTWF